MFDPAYGSGNFLVIAYKEMRAIEAEANRRRGEKGEVSAVTLTNFRGIEIRDFSAERIYIGRRFRNDTERLEYLFKYTKMTAKEGAA